MSAGPVRLLADDLTGALDSAAAFGPGVAVHLDRPGAAPEDSAAVGVVATATRDRLPADLPAALTPCVPWLVGAGLAFKKVDSLLRGNTLAEVRWLAAAGGFQRVVFAPALPAQGRHTVGGRLALVPPGGTPEQADVRGDNLRMALLAGPWPADCTLVLPDVRCDEDLDRLVADPHHHGPRTLWCGSAGLASAVARRWGGGAVRETAAGVSGRLAMVDPVWVVGASHQPVARRQWGRAVEARPAAVTVRDGDHTAFAQALAALSDGTHRLALLDLSPTRPLTPDEAATLLQQQVARLAALPQRPARLLVLGGDTARALARATGVTHLVSGWPVRAGWGRARWCGGRWDGLWMDCRSGAFGEDDDLLAVLRASGL
jgi:uncharacterized protein YgbK (DUF1537 family)